MVVMGGRWFIFSKGNLTNVSGGGIRFPIDKHDPFPMVPNVLCIESYRKSYRKNAVIPTVKGMFLHLFAVYNKKAAKVINSCGLKSKMAPRAGIEPATHCLEGSCSIL